MVVQRRRHERRAFRGSVAVWSGQESRDVAVLDMGGGGACLRLDAETAQRRVVTLRIGLGDSGITVLGRVVWRNAEQHGHRVAVEFMDLLPSAQQRLVQHLLDAPVARAA